MKKKFKELSRKDKGAVIAVIALLGIAIIFGGALFGMEVHQQREIEEQTALAEEKEFQESKKAYDDVIVIFERNKVHLNEEEQKELVALQDKVGTKEDKVKLAGVLTDLDNLKEKILVRHEGSVNEKLNSFVLLDGADETEKMNFEALKTNINGGFGKKELDALGPIYEEVSKLDAMNPAIAYRIALEKGVSTDDVLAAGGLAGIERVIQEGINSQYQYQQTQQYAQTAPSDYYVQEPVVEILPEEEPEIVLVIPEESLGEFPYPGPFPW